MAKPHDTHDQHTLQEQQMVKELLAELQTMDDKARIEACFCELVDCVSHNEISYQNEDEPFRTLSK